MAFVYRSERFIQRKPTSHVGPGEYHNLHLRNNTLTCSNAVAPPFNVNSKRRNLCLNENTPGPAAYVIHDNAFNKKQMFNVNNTNPCKVQFDAVKNETKDYKFVSAAPRFIDEQPDKINEPKVAINKLLFFIIYLLNKTLYFIKKAL